MLLGSLWDYVEAVSPSHCSTDEARSLRYDWRDKSHRLLYDLIQHILFIKTGVRDYLYERPSLLPSIQIGQYVLQDFYDAVNSPNSLVKSCYPDYVIALAELWSIRSQRAALIYHLIEYINESF